MYADLTSPDQSAERAEERDERDRDQPEDDEPPEVRVRHVDDVREDEVGPGSERERLEHSHDVVDGRMVSALLIAVVETVDVEEKDPERQRCHEEDDLPGGDDGVDPRRGWRKHHRNGVCSHEPGDVRGEEESSHEPTAAPRAPRATARARDLNMRRYGGIVRNSAHNPPLAPSPFRRSPPSSPLTSSDSTPHSAIW